MPFPATFKSTPVRPFILRCVLLAAVLLGMVCSVRLWLTARQFPAIPIVEWFPAMPGPWDVVFLALLLMTLVAANWFYRPAVALFLLGALFLYCGDQNRGQPWFYLYWILLLLTLLPERPGFAGCRIILSAVYIWAGLQKCGPQFQALVVPYLVKPVVDWLPAGGVTAVKCLLRATPALEIFIGVGLWVPVLRRPAIVLTVLIHATALLLLGPLGQNYNLVVWPWNLAMVALVVVLFPPVRLAEELRALRQSLAGTTVVALVTLLPALSYFGWWDSYFSFALYSGNTAQEDLYLTPSMTRRMPASLRRFAHPLNPEVVAANPTLEGLFIFDMQSWAQTVLGVPPIPEPRAYRAIARAIARHAEQPTDVQLLIAPRAGPLTVYRANDLF